MGKASTYGRVGSTHLPKLRAVGVSTWISIAFAFVVVGAALWFSVRNKTVARVLGTQPNSVWIPEPTFLLQHSADLGLSIAQRRHVQVAVRAWNLKKAAFDAQFKTLNTDSAAALADLKSHRILTGDYGKVVAAFDAERLNAWAGATKPLTSDQVTILDDLRNGRTLPAKVAFSPSPETDPALQADTARSPFVGAPPQAYTDPGESLDREIRSLNRQIRHARRTHKTAELRDLRSQLVKLHSEKQVRSQKDDDLYQKLTAQKKGENVLAQLIPTVPIKGKPMLIVPATAGMQQGFHVRSGRK